jgi:putative membrane protein
MLSVSVLPHLNAVLNGIAACLLISGFFFIKSGNRFAHRWCMVAALTVSGLFLISYVTLRFYTPIFVFQGEGAIRIFYYILLISHVLLAMAIVPLVLITVLRAFKDRFAAHKKIARWTWPVWMYVSVSGILVYLMLYQLYPLKTAQVM